jgi:predicted enzyme related to lactoylglutathione lyase
MARITALSFIVPVSDLDRAVQFYKEAFGLEEAFRNEQIVFMGLPGTDAAVGLVLNAPDAGAGPRTVGFHMDHAISHDDAARDVEAAGGRVVERGEHAPNVPFARITDPDGNELWI